LYFSPVSSLLDNFFFAKYKNKKFRMAPTAQDAKDFVFLLECCWLLRYSCSSFFRSARTCQINAHHFLSRWAGSTSLRLLREMPIIRNVVIISNSGGGGTAILSSSLNTNP